MVNSCLLNAYNFNLISSRHNFRFIEVKAYGNHHAFEWLENTETQLIVVS